MAHHKSANKRIKQSINRGIRNKCIKSTMKTNIKKAVNLLERQDINDTKSSDMILSQTISYIDKARQKGVIHRNTARRKISKTSRLFNRFLAK